MSDRLSALLADDDESNLRLAATMLELHGYRATTCKTGVDAIQLLERGAFDLVVVDWMMPHGDGLDVARFLRSSPKTAEVPVVCASARVREADRAIAYAAGCDAFLCKPYSRLAFGTAIQEAREKRSR